MGRGHAHPTGHGHARPCEGKMTGERGAHAGHDHGAMERDMRNRFFVSLILTTPVFLYSRFARLLGLRLPEFPGMGYLIFALSTVVVFYGGWPFFKGAYSTLKRGLLGMNVLVSLALLSGYVYSVGATFFFGGDDFFEAVTTLTVFLLFGHWMEMKAFRRTRTALDALMEMAPVTARVIRDGEVLEVPAEEVRVGDIVLVRPGESFPVDGVVIEGETYADESMLTGESRPVRKAPGDEVAAGTINAYGAVKVRAVRVGEDTAFAQIVRLVREAEESKPSLQRLADRAAHYLTIIAVVAALATYSYWALAQDAGGVFALSLAISVMVITCPHALGLAMPVVTTLATGLAARMGILVKDAGVFERLRTATTVVFDKTGTLTEGRPRVVSVRTAPGIREDELLALAASVEASSEHPIAMAIVEAAGGSPRPADGFRAVPGRGAVAAVDGREVLVGSVGFMRESGVDISELEDVIAEEMSRGRTVTCVASGGRLLGVISVADTPRPEAKKAVQRLLEMGLSVVMLTGDNEATARAIAQELGIERFVAEVMPEDKEKAIARLQEFGEVVVMVGDGINDAPALARADVGVAIGAGTNVAMESADVVLVRSDPLDVVRLFELSQAAYSKMVQNLFWATGYNAVAIPLAAGALYSRYGILIPPEISALVMSASSIIVVANALLLRLRWRPSL